MYFDGILTDRPTVTQRDEVSRSVTLPWMGSQSAQGRLAVVFAGVRSALSSLLKELGPKDIVRYLFWARLLNFMQRDMGDG